MIACVPVRRRHQQQRPCRLDAHEHCSDQLRHYGRLCIGALLLSQRCMEARKHKVKYSSLRILVVGSETAHRHGVVCKYR
eukprot:1097702-Pleurochrysis_carterae.AAC.21